ncbi:serine/arginine-rich splicing factor 11-like isoform X2 [Takifugu rubripes]|uniref:Serine/arginine-rich splicing factor 11-like n=1 Tax=Takifugu rubripes TaxID=31033 RepID=H2TFI2_TAKRU|nr:serine/arginine-rich splicing factor 11-like isoform X2 [Takifugu rubripes]XP_056911813.1 serine/arginine-rich splicing factor 11-like isoform X2 [Takifugu flavidus]|eukprot:XP_011614407.1 PREDICTED: serine/arginine-rich splicing factor 11-like [Takifugu rubripes]
MNYTTKVVQVTNVSPSATSEQMRTLFGFLGTIDELKLFPPDDSPMPVTSRVCFVKFQEPESVGVSQHLTNTVFVDRALIVVPFAEGSIPDEAKALSLLAPANAVAGNLPGGGLLPTPLPNTPMGGNPFGVPGLDAMAAFGFPGPNMNPQAADQLFKLMTDPKLNPLAAGLNLSASLKADASNKEIEEAMRRVRETQSLISAAIETGGKDSKRRTRSRTRSKSRRRSSASHSRYRRSSSRQRRRSNSRNRRRSKSPYQKRSRDRNRRSRTRSRDRKKEESSRRRSRTPPKSYSTTRRSHSRNRRRRKSQSISRSPKRKHSRSPSPRRHKKEKKKDKDKEKERDRKTEKDSGREEREQSSKKKKNKDKDKEKEREREREREREKKSEGEKGDTKVTRDYDEEEQGYDSEKEREERKYSDDSALSPQSAEGNGTSRPHKVKANGADNDDNMDVSD